jgi:hypothetical protein
MAGLNMEGEKEEVQKERRMVQADEREDTPDPELSQARLLLLLAAKIILKSCKERQNVVFINYPR